jgi:precorrin-2 dehydrogenase/sirohydrochlorin ferrochelatase
LIGGGGLENFTKKSSPNANVEVVSAFFTRVEQQAKHHCKPNCKINRWMLRKRHMVIACN